MSKPLEQIEPINLLNNSEANATSLAGDIAEKGKRIKPFEQHITLKPFNPTTLNPF